MIRDVEDINFRTVAQMDKPYIIYFWVSWCISCLFLGMALATLAADFEAENDVFKVNVDNNAALVDRFDARSVPILVAMAGGEVKGRTSGSVSRSRLEAFVGESLAIPEEPMR
jgi:thioredoxin-like negative regulator of GroEL